MLEPWLLSESFVRLAVVDSYKSLIWTNRYLGFGDFELVVPALEPLADLLVPDRYLKLDGEDSAMIIERTEYAESPEDGYLKVVTGRSLESIPARRVVWLPRKFNGSLQSSVKTLIDDNLIASASAFRNIPNFSFALSSDPAITSLVLDDQLFGENLYDVLIDICESNDISFRIKMPTVGIFVFELFSGVDRTYSQSVRAPVVFSPRFDNLVNSKSIFDVSEYKTSAIVEGADNIIGVWDSPAYPSGILRREIYVDATSVKQTVDGVTTPIADYNKILAQKGLNELYKNPQRFFFDGETADTELYQYGVHFNLGDTVQLENEVGDQGVSRVIEYIRSQEAGEYKAYPTFAAI